MMATMLVVTILVTLAVFSRLVDIRRLFGSVTDGVLHRAATPILVVPPHPSPHASTACVRLDHATASPA
jgi:hypothetical protein